MKVKNSEGDDEAMLKAGVLIDLAGRWRIVYVEHQPKLKQGAGLFTCDALVSSIFDAGNGNRTVITRSS